MIPIIKRLLPLVLLLAGPCYAQYTPPPLDIYSGYSAVPCVNTNTAFKIVTLQSNKVLCTPAGHAMFPRGFDAMDINFGIYADESSKTYQQYMTTKFTTNTVWFQQELLHIKAWGMNSLGQEDNATFYPYSQTTKLPFIMLELASQYALVNELQSSFGVGGWGTCCAKPTFKLLSSNWSGYTSTNELTDYRDPNWSTMVTGVLNNDSVATTLTSSSLATKGYLIGVAYDDSDNTHCFGAGPDFATQPAGNNDFRCGYMPFFLAPIAFATNFSCYNCSFGGTIYTDATVYWKKRWKDLLVTKYGSNPTVAGGTSGQALNTVWGSSYSSTGTSGACIGTLPAYVTPCGSTFSADSVGTGNGATLTFSTTLTHLTVDKFGLGIFVSGTLVGGDIGNGTIIGPKLSGTNTVNYATGAVTITFSGGNAPANTAPITASYIANGWGNGGTGLLDEDCRAGHASYCGAPNTACGGSDCYAIYLCSSPSLVTCIPANVQTDINAYTKDVATYYSSTIRTAIQTWAAAASPAFVGSVLYLGPVLLGTWSTPPDKYVIQGFCGNADAWKYGGQGTFSQAEMDFVDTNCSGQPLIETEYTSSNAQSPFSYPGSTCNHSGASVTCTIVTPNDFSANAGSIHIDTTCNFSDYQNLNVNFTATATTVTYTAPGTPTEASATCNVFYDDANVGGFASQAARGTALFNHTSVLPTRQYTASGKRPFIAYFCWDLFDDDSQKINWGLETLRGNGYNSVEDVNSVVSCSSPLGSFSCGGELRGAYGDAISSVISANTAIDTAILGLANTITPAPVPAIFARARFRAK